MSETLTLTLPMPVNIANGAHGHWMGRYREKERYQAFLDNIQTVGAINVDGVRLAVPRPPSKAFSKCTIRSTMHLGAAMDDDNALRRHKWALDWLKTRGYIADDRKKCLTWDGFPEQIIKRGAVYRITLTLTPTE